MKTSIQFLKRLLCHIQYNHSAGLLLTLFSCLCTMTYAGLMASTTRVILYEQTIQLKVPYSLTIANHNAYPIVSQVWLDDSNFPAVTAALDYTSSVTSNNPTSSPATTSSSNPTANSNMRHSARFDPPRFEVFPAIFKLNPNEIKALQILQTPNASDLGGSFKDNSFKGNRLNKMSLFGASPFQTQRSKVVLQEQLMWLNLLEMPLDVTQIDQTKDVEQHHMHLLMNTQLKVFFRPKGLIAKDMQQREQALKFHPIFNTTEPQSKQPQPITRSMTAIEVENPTGYYITFARLELRSAKQAQSLHHPDMMLAPFQRKRFSLDSAAIPPAQPFHLIRYVLIDDEGEYKMFERGVNDGSSLSNIQI